MVPLWDGPQVLQLPHTLDLPAAWAGLGPVQRTHGFPGAPPGAEHPGKRQNRGAGGRHRRRV